MSQAAEDSGPPSPSQPRRLARGFRWQAFFQHARDPVFVLDRRCRLLFVNQAWEKLTGLDADAAARLVCRRPAPLTIGSTVEDQVAHILTPPAEVRQGTGCRARRLLPGRPADTCWWEIEFLPLAQQGRQGGFLIVGRIRVLAESTSAGIAALPEKLVNLRQRVVQRSGLLPWESAVPGMRRLLVQARLASQLTVPVLLQGEPGTGKRTLARYIHYQGPQRERPLAVLDCRHLPAEAVADVLFPQTGAAPGSPAAVYLAEPGRLPGDLQLRLAALLSTASGADQGPTGPRILAGCCQPLAIQVQAGQMVEDLACSLGVLVLEVPPLRQRLADLPGLVNCFLQRANEEGDRQVTRLDAEVWEILRGHGWPGNLRELFAVLQGARDRAGGDGISTAELPLALRLPPEQALLRPVERLLPLDTLLEQIERRLIEVALRRCGGHKGRAAEMLSIWRTRLWRRIEALGIDATEKPSEGLAE